MDRLRKSGDSCGAKITVVASGVPCGSVNETTRLSPSTVGKNTKRGNPAATDADVVWITDLTKEAGVRQHDGAHSSILVLGPCLYVNTSNGLNDAHTAIENPEAPSLVVIDKATLTRELVETSGEFVLNVPARQQAAMTLAVGTLAMLLSGARFSGLWIRL